MSFMDKIKLEVESLKRSKKSSLEITAELNDFMIKLLRKKILREKGILGRKELVKELRKLTSE